MSLKDQKEFKILSLWTSRENEWLSYRDIVEGVKGLGISERTLVRYLAGLLKERKLLKEERGYKKTFYKPYDRFFDQFHKSRDYFRVHEADLGKLGKTLVDGLEKVIRESRYTDERIENLIAKELEKMPADMSTEPPWESTVYEKAISNVLSREKLSTADREELHHQIQAIVAKNLYFTLSNVPCAGTLEPHLLIKKFSNDIKKVLLSYAQLWYFIYKHPGASLEFRKYIKEKCPLAETRVLTI